MIKINKWWIIGCLALNIISVIGIILWIKNTKYEIYEEKYESGATYASIDDKDIKRLIINQDGNTDIELNNGSSIYCDKYTYAPNNKPYDLKLNSINFRTYFDFVCINKSYSTRNAIRRIK